MKTIIIYENILYLVYYERWRNYLCVCVCVCVCDRERERESWTDIELLWYDVFTFTPGGDTSQRNLASSGFFLGRLIQGRLTTRGCPPPAGLAPKTAWLFTANHWLCWLTDLSSGLKTAIVIYFSDAYARFPRNSRGFSAIFYLP